MPLVITKRPAKFNPEGKYIRGFITKKYAELEVQRLLKEARKDRLSPPRFDFPLHPSLYGGTRSWWWIEWHEEEDNEYGELCP